ncbi:MAG: hypothetical protein QOJ94_980 [Sphingomonadales bacterium]|jgi:hypothetical protein|nr:hypothetical protein [Sphingomonadales bacterium]
MPTTKIIQFFKAVLLVPKFLKAMRLHSERHMDEAIRLFEEVAAAAEVPLHFAMLGTAYVRAGKGDLSRRPFERAVKLATGRDPGSRYIRQYSGVYLAILDQVENIEPLIREAHAIKCGEWLRRWLPLPPTKGYQ